MAYYTVIAKSDYNCNYVEDTCLGTFSLLEKAVSRITEHRLVNSVSNIHQYFIYKCEIDVPVEICEDDSVNIRGVTDPMCSIEK